MSRNYIALNLIKRVAATLTEKIDNIYFNFLVKNSATAL